MVVGRGRASEERNLAGWEPTHTPHATADTPYLFEQRRVLVAARKHADKLVALEIVRGSRLVHLMSVRVTRMCRRPPPVIVGSIADAAVRPHHPVVGHTTSDSRLTQYGLVPWCLHPDRERGNRCRKGQKLNFVHSAGLNVTRRR